MENIAHCDGLGRLLLLRWMNAFARRVAPRTAFAPGRQGRGAAQRGAPFAGVYAYSRHGGTHGAGPEGGRAGPASCDAAPTYNSYTTPSAARSTRPPATSAVARAHAGRSLARVSSPPPPPPGYIRISRYVSLSLKTTCPRLRHHHAHKDK